MSSYTAICGLRACCGVRAPGKTVFVSSQRRQNLFLFIRIFFYEFRHIVGQENRDILICVRQFVSRGAGRLATYRDGLDGVDGKVGQFDFC